AGAVPERGPGRSDRARARSRPSPLRPRGRADARPAHGAAWRLRAQRAEPPYRGPAGGAVSDVSRPEPLLGSARGDRQALHVLRYQAVRRLIDRLVTDLIESVLVRLRERGIESLAAVRRVMPRLIEFSPEMTAHIRELKAFLYDRLYTHHRVTRMTQKADRIMSALFDVYMTEPKQLPPHTLA